MKIAVGASSFGTGGSGAISLLETVGIEVSLNPYGRKLTKDETIEHIKGCDGQQRVENYFFRNFQHTQII